MSAQPKATLEKILGSLGFVATVEEHTLDDGLTAGCQDRRFRAASLAVRARPWPTSNISPTGFSSSRINLAQSDVDVGGYRSQAREALVKKAQEAAEKVRRWGDVVELEPMSAFDRRIVHHALRTIPDVETHSVEVDGTEKKALILRPKKH